MLQIIQDQQQLFLAQIVKELLPGRHIAVEGDLGGLGNGRDHARSRLDRRQRNKDNPVSKEFRTGLSVNKSLRGLNGQAGLTDPPRPNQGQQAAVPVGQAADDIGQLFFSTNKNGRL